MKMTTVPMALPITMTRIVCVIVILTCSSHGAALQTGSQGLTKGKLISAILDDVIGETGRTYNANDLDPKHRIKRDDAGQGLTSTDAITSSDKITSTDPILVVVTSNGVTASQTDSFQSLSTLGVTPDPTVSDSTKVDELSSTTNEISSSVSTAKTIISTILTETTTDAADTTNVITTRTTETDRDSSSSTPCEPREAILTDFGKYGVLALAIGSGISFLFCFACLVVLCTTRCQNRKGKSKKKRESTQNVSDMRASVYRPRPSQVSAATHCVPTPLAMIGDGPTLTSSLRKTNTAHKNVMVTDLDDVDDLPVPNGATKEDESDRKFSFVDPANISTFLLRQTSVKLEEEEKRKKSLRQSQDVKEQIQQQRE